MGDLNYLKTAADRMAVGTVALSAAGLAIATDTTQPQNANAVTYIINGLFQSDLGATDGLVDLATAVDAADLNPDTDTPAKALFLLTVDDSGTVRAYQSEVVNPNGSPGYESLDGKVGWPSPPMGECAFGGLIVEVNSATTFTPGTTALNAAGMSTTYLDMAHVPAGRY